MSHVRCGFRDVVGFEVNTASTISSRDLLKLQPRAWGLLPDASLFANVTPASLYEAVLEGHVGVDDQDFLASLINSPVDHKLKSFTRNIVWRHKKVMLRYIHCAPDVDQCVGVSSLRMAFVQIWKNLQKTFPAEMLGSKRNWEMFGKTLKHLMSQGYAGVLPITSLMNGIKQTDVWWLDGFLLNGLRLRLLAKLLRLMVIWAFAFAKSFWAISDSPAGVTFLDRRLHQRKQDMAYNKLVKSGKLVVDDRREFRIQARIKFHPKENGVRPLTMIERIEDTVPSRDVCSFLRSAIGKYPWKTNHRGQLNDVVEVFKTYAGLRQLGQLSKIYFVKVDMADAFGSIRTPVLVCIIGRILRAFVPSNSMMKRTLFSKTDEVTGRHYSYLEYGEPEPRNTPTGYFPVRTEMVDVSRIAEFVRSTVMDVGLRFRGHNHALAKGIGQGIVSSVLLCDLYLRDLTERHLLHFVTSGTDKLFRHVDDVLYLTPDESRARAFLARMEKGFADYTLSVNPSKTRTNLAVEPFRPSRDANATVTFNGGVISVQHLSVQPQYVPRLRSTTTRVKLVNKKTRLYKKMSVKEILMKVTKLSGAKISGWSMDLSCHGIPTVLGTVRSAARFMAQKFLTSRLDFQAFSNRLPTAMIKWCAIRLLKSVRRMFDKRCPAAGRQVSDYQIQEAIYGGFLSVFGPRTDTRRIAHAVRRCIQRAAGRPHANHN